MEQITEGAVTEYIRRLFPAEGALGELEEQAKREHIPILQRETGRFLSVLTAAIRPKRILELGTAIGYSALLLARASDAQIISIERDEERFCRALANVAASGMENRIRLIHGEAETEIRNLPGKFDFIFIDAAKGQLPVHFELALEKLSPDGLIAADNVLYHGMVAQQGDVGHKHRTIVTRLRAFLETLCGDTRFNTAVLPIGDGVALVRRNRMSEEKE